jgi:parallel beta-helix repeat protein
VKYNFSVNDRLAKTEKGKMKRAVSGILLTLLLVSVFVLAFDIQPAKTSGTTWTVDDDGPADFHTIQEAIVAAGSGDTIYVYNGTYFEHISFGVYKTVTLIGENKYATIIDGLGYGSAVVITRTMDAKFTDFTIRNAEIGIFLDRTSNITIVDNVITNFSSRGPEGGICIWDSYDNTVANNTISNCIENVIYVWDSYNNVVAGNIISGTNPLEPDSSPIGIHLDGSSHDNTILGNVISNSTTGIYASQLAYNNTFAGNIIENLTSYECGINIWGPDSRIIGNTITGMSYVGIQLNSISSDGLYGRPDACANNIVSGNVISRCTFGINLILAAFSNAIVGNNVSNNIMGILISDSSNNSTVTENLVSNSDYGLLLFSSNNTRVYHNSFTGNTQQVLLSDSFNTAWDDGYPSGGNYWSDYGGADVFRGIYQNETGSDGIGDSPYPIDPVNQDNYPLMNPWAPPDVAILNVTTSKTVVRQGSGLDISVTVANLGNKVESFNLIVYGNTSNVRIQVIQPPIPWRFTFSSYITLPGDSTAEIIFTWNTSGFAKGVYRIKASAEELPSELNTTNNRMDDGTVFVTILGDVNGDGRVRVDDVLAVALAYGSNFGEPRYNANCDINDDLKIRIDDVLAAAQHFGQGP